VEAAVDPDHAVPDALLALLESWLVSVEPASEEIAGGETQRERKESLLWGHGRISMLPSGNFPVLAALNNACLVLIPPLMDRWLSILERHLTRIESPRVWAAIAGRYLRWLNLADRSRAHAFLDRLFTLYPGVLGTVEGIHLMAYLQHWINPENAQRWLSAMALAGENGAQGSGEVLMLRHALFPEEEWARTQVAALIASTDEATRGSRVGLVYALIHLWSEPEHRTLAHGYILPMLRSQEDDVLKTLSGIFLSSSFLLDDATRTLFDALCERPELLQDQRAEYLTERLEDLVTFEPERVARLANALLDYAGEAMTNMSTSWYLSSEPLLAVALALQDMAEPHRTAGVALFERMLEFNVPNAYEATLALDKRTANAATAQPPRRRRRRQTRK
jgi:hypothetical protein